MHHFAHLRAVAEGLDVVDNARRYLGVEHGHEAETAHKQTVDAVRAIAKRTSEKDWRLVGLAVRMPPEQNRPTLEDFIDQRDLADWSEEDVSLMYAEAYPESDKSSRRLAVRGRLMGLLKRLEQLHVELPKPTDRVSGWFDDVTAARMLTAGFVTLDDLRQRVDVGGRWFNTMPGIGVSKALRITAHLNNLLPPSPEVRVPTFEIDLLSRQPDAVPKAASDSATMLEGQSLVYEPLFFNNGLNKMLDASNDIQAIHAWIKLRAGSPATEKSYRKEANRFLLWLHHERGGIEFSRVSVEACGAYMEFLDNVPPHWISRRSASPGEVGWAPFRGPLSHDSQKLSIVIIASLFLWLQSVNYLSANPWAAVKMKTGDDRNKKMLDTKALSEVATSEVLRYIEAQPPSPTRDRIRFILLFVESVGLRSAELIGAKLGDLSLEPEGWVMHVHGKGSKNRYAMIPGQAFKALQDYLASRGVGSVQTAGSELPLIASVKDTGQPIGYQALYEHVKKWLKNAINASELSERERNKLSGVSTHWLRHTFGTRAIARNVPVDVIQAQMGHASVQTTTSIYGRAPIKRRADELAKAFS